MPLDSHGRDIRYLRISLTDHCNLRCVYCMPLTGLAYAPPEEVLTPEEIERVAAAAVRVGFRKFRLTGGEPTLRPELLEIVERLARLPGVSDLSMTTNGILLPRLAERLKRAGLRRVNLHVDTLNAERLPRIMRQGTLDAVRAGLRAAVEAGFSPLKINCVVTRGFNEEDVVDLARLTLEHDWHVRFVELMPLGEGECGRLARSQYVSNVETRGRIETALGKLAALPVVDEGDESRNYRLAGGRGVVGFISPVSEPYCGNCNRMRLTADGQLQLCLLNDEQRDLRAVLRRADRADDDLEKILLQAVAAKPIGHRLEEGISIRRRQMFQIGG